MKQKRIKLSKKANMITGWLVTVGTIFLIGIMGLTTMKDKNLTKNNYQETEIVYERITTNSGEDPMHFIFSKNNEKSFLIGNIVTYNFNKTKFNEQVVSGDTIVLTVLKSDFENKTTRIETLGIKKGNLVFMDFDEAFNKRVNNGRIGYIMALVLLPLSGVLTIAILIWSLLYNKRITGKKKISSVC